MITIKSNAEVLDLFSEYIKELSTQCVEIQTEFYVFQSLSEYFEELSHTRGSRFMNFIYKKMIFLIFQESSKLWDQTPSTKFQTFSMNQFLELINNYKDIIFDYSKIRQSLKDKYTNKNEYDAEVNKTIIEATVINDAQNETIANLKELRDKYISHKDVNYKLTEKVTTTNLDSLIKNTLVIINSFSGLYEDLSIDKEYFDLRKEDINNFLEWIIINDKLAKKQKLVKLGLSSKNE